MSLFERLLNLDSELIVLGTRMFVAKEELKNAILYPDSRYSSGEVDDWEEEDETEEEGEYESYVDMLHKKSEAIFEENRIRNEKEAMERARREAEDTKR